MNISLTQFPAEEAAWKRAIEQKIVELESRVFRLEQEIAQLTRNQVGNFPVDPNVTLP